MNDVTYWTMVLYKCSFHSSESDRADFGDPRCWHIVHGIDGRSSYDEHLCETSNDVCNIVDSGEGDNFGYTLRIS